MRIFLFVFFALFLAGYYYIVFMYMTNCKEDHFRITVCETCNLSNNTILTHDAETRFSDEKKRSSQPIHAHNVPINETGVAVLPSHKTTEPPIPESVLNFDLIVPNSEKAVCSDCFILHMGRRISYSKRNTLSRDPKPVSISIITSSTFERLAYLPYLLKRWPSYFVIAVQCKSSVVKNTVKYVLELNLPDRVSIVIMPLQASQHKFYVNKLRNLAIKAIRTTHFIPLDMDLWPMENLHSELLSLPSEILSSNETAVIIPAMFLKPELILPNCSSIMDCAIKSQNLFPSNKSDLRRCLKNRICFTMKERGLQHRYVTPKWINSDDAFFKMECFANRLQEPYIMLKYEKEMLLFDERFVDYGCNKVQYVDHLRLIGYEFYLLGRSYAMDLVHHDSTYRKSYLMFARAAKESKMRKVCNAYMDKAQLLYPSSAKVNICSSLY